MEAPRPTHYDVVLMKEKRPRTLAQRLTRLEDKEAIMNIVMSYSQLHDIPDWDTFMEMCTDDIERIIWGSVSSHEKGKKDLLAVYKRGQRLTRPNGTQIVYDPTLTRKHMMATPVIRILDSGKEGWFASYCSMVSTRGAGEDFVRSVHEATIVLNFVKQGKEWKLRRMLLNTEIGHDPLRKQ